MPPLLALLPLLAPVAPDVLDLVSVKDNTLYESLSGIASNGLGQHMFAGQNGLDATRRAVLAFDVGAVPAGSVVTSAELTLFMSRTIVGSTPVSVHRLAADWGEGTSAASGEEGGGIASTSGDATWIHTFYPGSAWSAPGGDFVATPSATRAVNAFGPYTWGSATLAADVQAWVDDPESNFGWIVLGREDLQPSAKRFDTHENAVASRRPLLRVEFTLGTGRPGTALCFGVGCPCGNDDPDAGCANSGGAGARLEGSGTNSVGADDLVLTATGCPPGNSGLYFAATTPFTPPVTVGDGFGCAGGGSFRYLPDSVDGGGVFAKTNAVSTAAAGFITPGDTRFFQAWTRDVLCGPPPNPCPSPCGANNNLSNAYSVTFTP